MGINKEIENLKTEIREVQKEKNKYFDEKLKIEEVIDQQVEQVEYWNNKAMKLEDELQIRKQIEDEIRQNLKNKDEEIRQLKISKSETVIKSFDVKFVNIEDAKVSEENLTIGTVQAWQSLENENEYFLRLTYTSKKDKNVKTFTIDAGWLGGIIPITDKRAAISWKDSQNNNKKQEVEVDNIEELLLEIGNLTYR